MSLGSQLEPVPVHLAKGIFCLIEKNNLPSIRLKVQTSNFQDWGGRTGKSGIKIKLCKPHTQRRCNELIDSFCTWWGAISYFSQSNARSPNRPNVLAGFQLAESGSVRFWKPSQRAATEAMHPAAEKTRKTCIRRKQARSNLHCQCLKQLNKQC